MKEQQIKIASTDVFPNSTVRPSALQRYMQQLAREDCDDMGCTYPFMREHNTVFVVTKLGISLDRPLREGETFTLRTYNNSISGITFDREYDILSNGSEIGHCSSLWVLVRYDTRALVRPRDFPFEFECKQLDCRKVEMPRGFSGDGMIECGRRVVRVSDLDENNHLNNCVYPDIALDAIDDFDGLSEYVSGMRIIFRHEAHRLDELVISSRREDSRQTVFAHNDTTGQPCFEAEFLINKFQK